MRNEADPQGTEPVNPSETHSSEDRVVSPEIMKKMPASTTTFVERSALETLRNRIVRFLQTGE